MPSSGHMGPVAEAFTCHGPMYSEGVPRERAHCGSRRRLLNDETVREAVEALE